MSEGRKNHLAWLFRPKIKSSNYSWPAKSSVWTIPTGIHNCHLNNYPRRRLATLGCSNSPTLPVHQIADWQVLAREISLWWLNHSAANLPPSLSKDKQALHPSLQWESNFSYDTNSICDKPRIRFSVAPTMNVNLIWFLRVFLQGTTDTNQLLSTYSENLFSETENTLKISEIVLLANKTYCVTKLTWH